MWLNINKWNWSRHEYNHDKNLSGSRERQNISNKEWFLKFLFIFRTIFMTFFLICISACLKICIFPKVFLHFCLNFIAFLSTAKQFSLRQYCAQFTINLVYSKCVYEQNNFDHCLFIQKWNSPTEAIWLKMNGTNFRWVLGTYHCLLLLNANYSKCIQTIYNKSIK